MKGDHLVNAFLDDELDENTRRSLEKWLLEDVRHRDGFVLSAFVLQPLLEELFDTPRDLEGESQLELASALGTEGPASPVESVVRPDIKYGRGAAANSFGSHERKTSWGFVLAMAAALLVAAGLPLLLDLSRASDIGSLRVGPACVWASGSERFEDGDRVCEGDTLRIDAGSVVVRFESGIAVSVNGPASVTLVDDLYCELDYGSIAAASAEGFTVGAKGLRFVDLGTEFVVTSDVIQKVEIDVLKGIVEAVFPTTVFESPSLTIVEGRAFVFDTESGEITEAAHEPSRSALLPRTDLQPAIDKKIGSEQDGGHS